MNEWLTESTHSTEKPPNLGLDVYLYPRRQALHTNFYNVLELVNTTDCTDSLSSPSNSKLLENSRTGLQTQLHGFFLVSHPNFQMLRCKVQQPEGLLVKLSNKIILKNVGTLKLTHPPSTLWLSPKYNKTFNLKTLSALKQIHPLRNKPTNLLPHTTKHAGLSVLTCLLGWITLVNINNYQCFS
jgi:hypothetical protein